MPSPGYIGVSPADRDPTVSDNSVTTGKIQDNAVTGAKIAMTSDAQGDILYYNGTDYVRLGPGTSGYALKTAGASANPAWGEVTSTGDFANGGDTATANRVLGNNDAYALGFETNGSTRLSIGSTGFMTGQAAFSVGNTATVTTTTTTPASENMMSVGPITIDTSVTVTIGASGTWLIV